MSWKKIPWTVVVPCVFVAVVFALSRVGTGHEYDEDEGLNLMKALLVARGHPLYSQVWDDQPPGLTYLLAGVFKVIGPSVVASRVIVLGFAAVLLWALGAVLRVLHGRGAAVAGMLLLMGAYFFVRLSFSVMIGLPAVAMGMVSVYLLVVWRVRSGVRRTGDFYLLLSSAVLFALALLTKMFVVEMVPVVVAVMLAPGEGLRRGRLSVLEPRAAHVGPHPNPLPEYREREKEGSKDGEVRGRAGGWMVAWGVIVAGLFGLGVAGAGVDFSQAIGTHVRGEMGMAAAHGVLGSWARRDWDLILLGVGAVVLGWVRRDWRVVIPGVWAGVSLGVLFAHRPIWYHHTLLVSVPLAWLGGIFVGWVVEEIRSTDWRPRLRYACVVGLVLLGGYGGWKFYKSAKPLIERENDGAGRVVAALREGEGEWVFADRPMDAFRSGKGVPPEVAVLSAKRMGTSAEMDREVAAAIGRYRPSRVEVGRFKYGAEVRGVLGRGYRVGVETKRGVVWESKD